MHLLIQLLEAFFACIGFGVSLYTLMIYLLA